MAFGDLRGTLQIIAGSITNPFAATGSVVVAVGDLVVAVLGQQTALTVTTVSDNLGNTYTAQNAGTDAGTPTGRAYYSRVTVAGTLTSVSAVTTSSANDAVFAAAAFAGPFATSPLDVNPANIANDLTTPMTCPATGTLAQASELVVAWMTWTSGSATCAATSPNLLAIQLSASINIMCAIGYQVVAATTTVSPEFTTVSNPTGTVLGTMSFMAVAATFTFFGSFDAYSGLRNSTPIIGY